MQQETFDFVKGNPFEVTQDDMRKLDSYLSQFLENNQDELTPILTDREIQDINIFQESNISNLPIQEGSIISVFDELVKNSQDELNKKCLENSKYELSIFDERYFDNTSAITRLEYLNR